MSYTCVMPPDDDFWVNYIAATPEEDNDFRGIGRIFIWPIVVLLVVILVAALLK